MHIIHVNLAKGFHEGEAQTLLLMKHLRKQGVRQTLVCRKGSELATQTEAAGILTHLICGPLAGHWKYLGGDIVHVHDTRSIYWAWFEYFFSKTPYVITRRRDHPLSSGYLTQRAHRNAAALVGTSKDIALALSETLYCPAEIIPDAYLDDPLLVELGTPIQTAPPSNLITSDQMCQEYLRLYNAILENPTGCPLQDLKDAPVVDPLTSASHSDSTYLPH